MKKPALDKARTLAKSKVKFAKNKLVKNKKAINFTKQIVLLHKHREEVTNKKVKNCLDKEILGLKTLASFALKSELRRQSISYDDTLQLERMANLLCLNNVSTQRLILAARSHCTFTKRPISYPNVELHSKGYELQILNFNKDELICYQLSPFN